MLVRMLSTFAPSNCSIARLTSILFAPVATSNTIVRPSSRRSDVFSVMSGRRITSVSFIGLPQRLLELFQRAASRHHMAGGENLARGQPRTGYQRHTADVAHRARQLFVSGNIHQYCLAGDAKPLEQL